MPNIVRRSPAREAFDATPSRVHHQRAEGSDPASVSALRDRLDALANGAPPRLEHPAGNRGPAQAGTLFRGCEGG